MLAERAAEIIKGKGMLEPDDAEVAGNFGNITMGCEP